jgi:uncharacterized membrane protein YhaH (DUF805 family)
MILQSVFMQLSTYLSFQGKARRSEYWAIYLISTACTIPALLVAAGLALLGIVGTVMGAFLLISFACLMTLITIATVVRRCNDIGISPWFTLTLLIPYVNFITFIVFGCVASEKENSDGPTTNT